MLALAIALRAAGHEPLMALPAIFASRAARFNLPFKPIAVRLDQQAMNSMIEAQIAAANGIESAGIFLDTTLPMLPELFSEVMAACVGADLLICTPFHLAGRMVHEACGIPFATLHISPFGITGGGPLRDATAPRVNAWRTRLGFPALHDPLGDDGASPWLALHSISRLLLRPGPHWPAHHHVTGFFFLDEPYNPDPGLQAFLEAGDPPVVVSLGSMTHENPGAVTNLLVTAIRQSGRRMIIQRGWSGLAASFSGEDVHVHRLCTPPLALSARGLHCSSWRHRNNRCRAALRSAHCACAPLS